MSNSAQPTEAPPPYMQDASGHLAPPAGGSAVGSAPRHRRTPSNASTASSNYTSEEDREVEGAIPPEGRRELIDVERPLPEGWTREYDTNSQHFFYVDTKVNPPRSIWSHPLDPIFLDSHPEIAKQYAPPAGPPPTNAGSASTSTSAHSGADEKKHHFFGHGDDKNSQSAAVAHEQRQHDQQHAAAAHKDDRTLGRKMKDKLTGKTHDQRVAERKQRAEEEKKQYEEYLRRRAEMLNAINQGQYRTSYAAPADPYRVSPLYGGRYGGGYGYGGGYSRYGGGMYPAGRMGYGNGIGMGMAPGMMMTGGLLGGLALGGLMF